jgi:pimeloyl-ACP methyl ester carboxylesterase
MSVVAMLLSSFKLQAQTNTARYVSMNANTNAYYEYLPQGYSATGTQKYPLILFVHGLGELGAGTSSTLPTVLRNGIPRLINQGSFPTSFTVNGQTYRFIVICPQFVAWPQPTDIDQVLNYVVSHYNVDISRIYLTGLSMGGGVTWEYAGNQATDAYAKRLAAIAPICGASYPSVYRANVIAKNNVPVWAFHNQYDPTAPVSYTIDYVNAINAYVPTPVPPAKKTIFPVSGHDAWTQAYNPSYRENNMNVYEWMLQYSRGGATLPPPNSVPVANAGADKSITLPTNSVQLTGSGTDADGSIASYSWTKIAGPTSYTFSSTTVASPTVSNLAQGTYTFRLTVKDNSGATDTDDVNVVVNGSSTTPPPPSGTRTIKVNVFGGSNAYTNTEWNNWNTSSSLASTTFKYSDGTASSVKATLSQQNAVSDNGTSYTITMAPKEVGRYASYSNTTRTLSISGLDNTKTYTLELYASRAGTSNNTTRFTVGATSVDIKTDNNLDKKAVFTVTPVNGTITVNLTKLNTYNYLDGFALTEGSGSTSIVTANAGLDKSITLPTSSVQLIGSGSSTSGSTLTYNWTKIAGPTSFTFSSTTIASPTVSNLVQGTYTFRLTVKDNSGATATDDVNVVVNGSSSSTAIVSKYIKVNVFGGSNAYTNTEWNNWNTSSSLASTTFKYSDGTASSVKATLSQQNAVSDNGTSYTITMAPKEVGRYASYSNTTRTLSILGLDNTKTYTLELYASRAGTSNNTTRFTVGATSVDIKTDNNLDKKAVFTVTPVNGTITVNLTKLNTYNYLDGFMITENGGTTVSGAVSVQSNSVELQEKQPEINVFPNPVASQFVLQTNILHTGQMSVQVLDVNGVIQKQWSLTKNLEGTAQTYLSMGELKPGEYIIRVQIGDWVATKKIIKN